MEGKIIFKVVIWNGKKMSFRDFTDILSSLMMVMSLTLIPRAEMASHEYL